MQKEINPTSEPTIPANIARDNHFIPQMYQLGWSNDGKNIWEYKTLVHDARYPAWQRRSIISTGVWKNFYVRVSDGKEIDDFEHMFNEQFESPAADPLKRAREGESLTQDDWKAIARFICAQHVRTPGFYIASKEVNAMYIPEAIKETLEEIRDGKPAKIDTATGTGTVLPNVAFNELVPLSMTLIDLDEDHTGVKFEVTVGKGFWLNEIQHHLNDQSLLMRTLCSLEWSIVDAPEGVSWPTSDRPLVFGIFLPNGNTTCVYGLLEAHILLFPISSQKLLATCLRENLPSKHFVASAEGAKLFREMIINNAFLSVYSACEDNEVQTIRPRVVDDTEATHIENELDSWYDTYDEKEAPLLGNKVNIVDNRTNKSTDPAQS